MKSSDQNGIKSSTSGGNTIRVFRDARAGTKGVRQNGERRLLSGRAADSSGKKEDKPNKDAKHVQKADTGAENKKNGVSKPTPSSAIKNAVDKKRNNGKASAQGKRGNSWRKASAIYSKKDAERKAKKEKQALDKRTRTAIIAVSLIVLTAAACVGAYLLSVVKTISVSECTSHTKNDIINAAGIYTGKCILTYDTDAIKRRLEEDPYLEVLSVEKIFPDEISIEVAERSEYAAISTGHDSYCIIDRSGFILFAGRREAVTGLKTVYGLGTTGYTTGTRIDSDKSKLRPYVLMELIRAFGQRDNEIESIDITIPASLRITTTDGYTVMLGDSVEIESKTARMFAALDKARESGTDSRVIYINASGTADIGGGTVSPAPSAPTEAPTAEATIDPEAEGTGEPAATDAPDAEEPQETPAP